MQFRSIIAVITLALGLPLVGVATAQDNADPALQLRDLIEAPPNQGIDTVLLFTNLGKEAAKVTMQAYHRNGARAGQKDLEVPGNGLAYVLASELDNSTDPTRRFLGKVEALGRGHLTATAVLVGGPLTDLPAQSQTRRELVRPANPTQPPITRAVTQMTFPVVAAF